MEKQIKTVCVVLMPAVKFRLTTLLQYGQNTLEEITIAGGNPNFECSASIPGKSNLLFLQQYWHDNNNNNNNNNNVHPRTCHEGPEGE